jgi:hypothetical protein
MSEFVDTSVNARGFKHQRENQQYAMFQGLRGALLRGNHLASRQSAMNLAVDWEMFGAFLS